MTTAFDNPFDPATMSRRGVLGAGIALASTPLLGGCGGGEGDPPAPQPSPSPTPVASPTGENRFVLGQNGGAISSLRYRADTSSTDYVRSNTPLGRVFAFWRADGGAYAMADTVGGTIVQNGTTTSTTTRSGPLSLASSLTLDGADLAWRITVRNEGTGTLEIGDLFMPLPMNTDFLAGQPLDASVLKHSFVSGHGSHIFWMRANSVGPFLLMLPDERTQLQYWQRRIPRDGLPADWCAFIHAGVSEANARAGGTRWRQPTDTLVLRAGEERQYGFRFQWVAGYAEARAAIAAAGLIDVEVAPGMTVPRDLHVDIALRSSRRIAQIDPEFPATTTLTALPDQAGYQRWRVTFARLGENRLTLVQPGDRRTVLEFFATEPLETMIAKRGAFIAAHQHRDPSKWYDGLLAEWNMESGVMLGPDNYDRIMGWRIYAVTCDDPGLSKPAFLALKNAEHPVAAEVAALDYYIENFVWGGLQLTDTESDRFPYGIYGIPDWRTNRASTDPGANGRAHLWRTYDYPHIFAMYLAMHRIARDHPGVPVRLSAATYLTRAYRTAVAMFTIPISINGWSGYDTPFYNELVIPELVDALRRAGRSAEADELNGHWRRKVQYFASGNANLFKSEYAFDSTGFETTQALARAALDDLAGMGVSREAAVAFRDKQIAANLFCRGWLEPAYYYLGSDYRNTQGDAYVLTYMAQMGGWAVLDYALNDAADPHPLLRLGYASQLSSWALLNSGTAADGYGYWYPGAANDGGAGGGFEPAPVGRTWLEQPHHRGSWYYSCEIDLGFCGALRAARTVVADDPIFGRIAYGARLRSDASAIAVEPADGVRRRLSLRVAGGTCDVELQNARFAAGRTVTIAADGSSVRFTPEGFDRSGEIRARVRRGTGAWRQVTVAGGTGEVTLATG